MGDRGNVILHYGEQYSNIYLYTHYDGSALVSIVAKALDFGSARWTDDIYLPRIIFSYLTQGDMSEYGYGLSPFIGDGRDQTVTIDFPNRTVQINDHSHDTEIRSFNEFVNKFLHAEV